MSTLAEYHTRQRRSLCQAEVSRSTSQNLPSGSLCPRRLRAIPYNSLDGNVEIAFVDLLTISMSFDIMVTRTTAQHLNCARLGSILSILSESFRLDIHRVSPSDFTSDSAAALNFPVIASQVPSARTEVVEKHLALNVPAAVLVETIHSTCPFP